MAPRRDPTVLTLTAHRRSAPPVRTLRLRSSKDHCATQRTTLPDKEEHSTCPSHDLPSRSTCVTRDAPSWPIGPYPIYRTHALSTHLPMAAPRQLLPQNPSNCASHLRRDFSLTRSGLQSDATATNLVACPCAQTHRIAWTSFAAASRPHRKPPRTRARLLSSCRRSCRSWIRADVLEPKSV